MNVTSLYRAYRNMIARCDGTDPKAKYYHGRGIRVCDEWKTWYAFRDWATANGYKEGLSLDRRVSTDDYVPWNCRWIPMNDNRIRRHFKTNPVLKIERGIASLSKHKSWNVPLGTWQYYCLPGRKQRILESTKNWQKRNPERNKQLQRKYRQQRKDRNKT